ncbi:MAG: hypothetical protein ONA69_07775 [candidate division KSB1 bacterium]|nr:hypothetical protein [candidate division KSB1 bacterium]
MKKTVCLAALLVFSTAILKAQISDGGLSYMGSSGNVFYGGIGLTAIDSDKGSETYFNVHLRPEFAFGKLGVGLNVNLLFNTKDGKLRSQDWDQPTDILQQIRYIRWGRKNDPLYVHAGTMDAARLGHGSVLNYYTNAASYDSRKFGGAVDIDFGYFGFESVFSNFARAEIIGGRVYGRPLRSVLDVPVLKNLTLGGTLVRDVDPDGVSATSDGVSVYGADLELPIVKKSSLGLYFYYDWSQIYGYSSIEQKSRTFGNGHYGGVAFDLSSLAGNTELHAKFERRVLSKEFVPSFFDAFYEIQRYNKELNLHKTDLLLGMQDEVKGWFGELWGRVMDDKIRLLGMYSYYDKEELGGTLHFAFDAPNLMPVLAMHATYDKIQIETIGDVLTLDNRSLARAGIGYKINPYLILYVDYIWTFEETEPGSGVFQPQERFEPKLVLSVKF